ncbi:MAG: hypothetical protein VB064_13480 [Oscillospiraceae bacterium]|nr:hypothetical protein [Oscillospiraceae bacterium]
MIKKKARFERRSYIFLFFIIFGLIFVRYCYYGFNYFYQLDDYIQYHNYTAYYDDKWALINNLGMLSARPLAGIFDLFIWSRFYGCMILAVGIISAMYAASTILLHTVFSKRFGTGYLFFIVYALLPMGFEGSYWVSASSRIVVGMFFAALSFYCFDKWCGEGGKRELVLFAVMQFAAFCFYEQIVFYSGALTLVIMLLNVKGSGRSRAAWGFFMFANAALYAVITKLMPAGVYGERAELFLPWQDGYKSEVFTPLLLQLKEVFVGGSAAMLGGGLLRGFKLLISEPNALYVLAVPALCFAFYSVVKKSHRENISFFAELFSGILLAAAPIVLFFFLKAPWFGLRNAVTSFCGLGLILDALFDLVFGRLKSGKAAEDIIVAALALLCCVASVSELHDYRETTLADTRIATAASEAFEGVSFGNNDSIWLLNVDASYVKNGNFYYHEHNYGVTSSPWALTGAIRAVSGRGEIPTVSPVSVYAAFAAGESEITKASAYCCSDGNVVPAIITKTDDNLWQVADGSGQTLGTLSYVDGGLWLKMK